MTTITTTNIIDDLIFYYQDRLSGCLFWNKMSHKWGLYDIDSNIHGKFAPQRRSETAKKIVELRTKIRLAKELKQQTLVKT